MNILSGLSYGFRACSSFQVRIPKSQWRRNEHDDVSNHQPHDCLLNRLFGPRSKKTAKLRVTGLCEGNSPVTEGFPAQGPVTQKLFPSHDVIMRNDSHRYTYSFIELRMAYALHQ